MRSLNPIPGNPWPHDMVITVEDRPHALVELLWIREAYDLRVGDHNLPPLLTATPESVGGLSDADRTDWQEAWPRLWWAAATHAGRDDTPAMFDELSRTPDGSPERFELLERMLGPTWRGEFGDAALEHDSFRAWDERAFARQQASRPTRLEDHPERRDLDALVGAWHAGLTKVVTIPCHGEYTHWVTDNALLMTERTRADSAAYRRALAVLT